MFDFYATTLIQNGKADRRADRGEGLFRALFDRCCVMYECPLSGGIVILAVDLEPTHCNAAI